MKISALPAFNRNVARSPLPTPQSISFAAATVTIDDSVDQRAADSRGFMARLIPLPGSRHFRNYPAQLRAALEKQVEQLRALGDGVHLHFQNEYGLQNRKEGFIGWWLNDHAEVFLNPTVLKALPGFATESDTYQLGVNPFLHRLPGPDADKQLFAAASGLHAPFPEVTHMTLTRPRKQTTEDFVQTVLDAARTLEPGLPMLRRRWQEKFVRDMSTAAAAPWLPADLVSDFHTLAQRLAASPAGAIPKTPPASTAETKPST